MPTPLNDSELEPLDNISYPNGSDDRAQDNRPRCDQEFIFIKLLLGRCIGDLRDPRRTGLSEYMLFDIGGSTHSNPISPRAIIANPNNSVAGTLVRSVSRHVALRLPSIGHNSIHTPVSALPRTMNSV